jgi:hypothetical protein
MGSRLDRLLMEHASSGTGLALCAALIFRLAFPCLTSRRRL